MIAERAIAAPARGYTPAMNKHARLLFAAALVAALAACGNKGPLVRPSDAEAPPAPASVAPASPASTDPTQALPPQDTPADATPTGTSQPPAEPTTPPSPPAGD